MIEEVKKDILNILKETLEALKNGNYVSLKEISNHTLHNASIYQDKDSVSIAVIIYSIYKIASRSEGSEKNVLAGFMALLQDTLDILEEDKIDEYARAVKRIFNQISKADKEFGIYVEEVINQAEIKKGSKLYEHGLSMSKAADILGVSQWELMNYVGKTIIPEVEAEPFDIRARVDFTKKLFGV